MDADIRIRAVGLLERDLLVAMYERFEPLGVAAGLPPYTAEARRSWIGGALRHKVNVAAFSPAGEVVGHCFLVGDRRGSAELAIFVHQESRRKGVGAALLRAALEWAGAAGLRRVWSMTASDNRAALRLLESCGFRLTKFVSNEAELEIDLPWRPRLPDPKRYTACDAQPSPVRVAYEGPRHMAIPSDRAL